MSGAQKKRTFENKPENESSGNSDSEDDLQAEAYTGGEEIQVEFEGRNPIDSDFHGIKQLLIQLFLKAHLNLSELADLIIGQNYVGSVVKQSANEDGDEEEDDDEMSDINEVFGVTSVINITSKQNVECVQQLRKLLVELAEKHATDSTVKLIKDILGNASQQTGLLINERFINIPAQIAVPLLENLYTEIQRAMNKKMPFDFTYFILICKLYKYEGKQKKSNKNDPEIIWSNQEEEVLLPEAVASFEFSVKDEADAGMGGHWLEGDTEMTPYRKILVFDASSFPRIIETVKNYVS